MLVQRVVSPVSSRESWTVLGDDDVPVEPVERYLAYLTDIERSPNTVKAYAHDLKDWFVFLADRGLDWRRCGSEDVGEFVAWLRLPLPARGRAGGGAAVGGASLRRVDGEPEAVGAGCVLSPRRPRRRRCRRAAGDVAGRRVARRVEAVPAPHQQERAAAAAGGRVEGAEEAAAGADCRARCRRSWTGATGCGTGCCLPCCTTPGCGSVRHSGCGTTISPPPSGR